MSGAGRGVDDLWAAAARSWPELALTLDQFKGYLDTIARPAAALDEDAARELYLALALRLGSPRAHAAFEARYLDPIEHKISGVVGGDLLDEVKQRVRVKLLVPGDDGSLRVEQYAGHGRLAGLVLVVATREAISLRRRGRIEAPLPADDDLARLVDGPLDPARGALKAEAQQALRAAFARAIGGLSARERNLLRLHWLRGVSLDRLATLHGVHRATIVRWLASAREQIAREIRRELSSTLGLSGADLESALNSAQSHIDLSAERLLATASRSLPPGEGQK